MDLTTPSRGALRICARKLVPSRFEKGPTTGPGTRFNWDAAALKGDGVAGTELASRGHLGWWRSTPPPRSGSGSTFAQQLQHSLRQLALVELHQTVLNGWWNSGLPQRPGEPIQRTLVLELMGRHSNLLLLDEQRRIIASGPDRSGSISPACALSPPVIPTAPPPMLQGLAPDRNGGL